MTQFLPSDSDNAEARILAAAKQVFYRKGLDGARMQEIADEAGINKAMLHYYFRSKDKLFERIFLDALGQVVPKVAQTLVMPVPLLDKFTQISGYYHDLLLEQPYLPGFVLQTIQQRPEFLLQFVVSHTSVNPQQVFLALSQQIQENIAQGKIRPIEPGHLLLNFLGMCMFPFMIRPIITKVAGLPDEAFVAFVNQRRTLVPQLLMDSLRPEQPPAS